MSKVHPNVIGVVLNAVLCVTCVLPVSAQSPLQVESITRMAPVSFHREILPVLKKKCLACHNASDAEGELILESPATIGNGSASGAVIVPGDSASSLLFMAAAHLDGLEMPPAENGVSATNLTPQELGMLKRWIDQGAPADASVSTVALDWRGLPSHVAPIYSAAITPHGRYAAVGRGNRLFVYQLATRGRLEELRDRSLISLVAASEDAQPSAHLDLVNVLTFSPDGTLLASGGFRTVKIWRKELGVAVAEASQVASSKVPKQTYSLQLDGTRVSVQRLTDSALVHHLDAGTTITSGAVNTDASRVAVITADGQVQLFDALSRKKLAVLSGNVPLRGQLSEAQHQVAISNRQRQHAKVDVDTTMKVYEESTKRLVRIELERDAAAKTLQEKKQAVRDKTKEVDAKREQLTQAKKRVEEQVQELRDANSKLESAGDAAGHQQITQRDQANAALASARADADARQKLLDEAVGQLNQSKEAQSQAERALAGAQQAVPRNKQDAEHALQQFEAAKAAEKNAQAVAKTAQQQLRHAQQWLDTHRSRAFAAAFTPDGKLLAVVAADGHVYTYAAANGVAIDAIPVMPSLDDDVNCQFAGNDVLQITANDDVHYLRTNPRWRLSRTLGALDAPSVFVDRVTSLAFSPDGKQLAIGSGEPSRTGQIKLFDVATGKLQREIDQPHSDAVLALAYSSDGEQLASASADKLAKIFDLEDGSLIRTLEGHTGHILALSWHPDGRALVTAGSDQTIKVWDAATGEQKKTVEGFKKEVTDIAFLGTGDMFAASTGEGTVVIRKTDGGGGPALKADGASGFIHALDATRDGEIVVAGGEQGVLHIWQRDGEHVASFALGTDAP